MSGSAELNGSPTTSYDYIWSNDARDELHGQQLPDALRLAVSRARDVALRAPLEQRAELEQLVGARVRRQRLDARLGGFEIVDEREVAADQVPEHGRRPRRGPRRMTG